MFSACSGLPTFSSACVFGRAFQRRRRCNARRRFGRPQPTHSARHRTRIPARNRLACRQTQPAATSGCKRLRRLPQKLGSRLTASRRTAMLGPQRAHTIKHPIPGSCGPHNAARQGSGWRHLMIRSLKEWRRALGNPRRPSNISRMPVWVQF